MNGKTLYNVREASQIMHRTPELVRQMIEAGKIPNAVVLDGKRKRYIIPAKPFEQWLGLERTEI